MEPSGTEQLCDDPDPGGKSQDQETKKQHESEQKLSKITHNALENINVIGQGLKHLFQHQRRRSSVSPHDVQQAQAELEPDLDLESQSVCADIDGVSTHPTALNRVLQQIRVPPKMKRGTSLHSRWGKADAPKGSPQINRRSAQDIQSGRPRSSSTTDAPTNLSVMEIASSIYVGGEEAAAAAIERLEVSSLAQTSSAVASSTDGSINTDSVDGTPDPQRTKVAITHLQQKILKLTEQIKIEQTARDDNVAEYLKLANNADKQQSARIKQVFEKKNQKSAQTILQLQKKLEHYHRKLREIEQNGIPRQPKDVFRDMHQGLKDVGAKVTGFSEGVVDSVKGGLSSFSQATHSAAGAVVSKPREIASLIRNKFGSADNIANLKDSLEEGQEDGTGSKTLGIIQNFQSSPKYGSEEDCSSATSGSVGANSTTGGPVGASSSKTNTLDMQSSGFDAILHEIQEIRETQARLEESFEDLKVRYQRDYTLIMQTLQEERYRCERLEEQLNDLTELHQNEILNLKQELASMEEKIAYQSYERARDIQEALEACQTRISKMELQQQQQQVVQLEGLENATARNLLGKFINILLAVMAVLLVFVSTVANCVVPLMKTRNRTFSTLFIVVFIAFLWKHWDAITGYLERFLSPPR
ncbi:PREDICTED: transmembrane and coiled-coil domains protein 1 isoform X1 [Lepidothrix coronata]|uniref:Transmembrane and coiled-coil domains protein 1 isoform X1 n=2 Tax=Lepidothrix coronata TaxID=321398 RepID=A0A6J0I8X3_9PASS|nr:PREDICTED: transmembrane and coiled-coil domains protein 1 isoform X1 [Lepidothrix coronata]XP_017682547.1 PREDICTED: transmembrane and coiled-coil domains protein 1 isoform X1 [Lepidothrix coronata]XP_017682548.1 PREDICTED: transmembrane and coiled-coil domains protein 1 isoform X1 [Lepidothrix coronata]XP_017682549.1 PREDICTED: transmembrane and coiled-coil domains protein 1 isoform X1 [Lepidothrix coronata]XP_017682550.1 PREDICTED: transmembrane and coiled-coil domains protein 1 isoform X